MSASTEIVAYVLGATLEEGLGPADYGENKNLHIIPMVYQTVLRKANQRTFNLQKRLQEVQPTITTDPEVEEVLRSDGQKELFENVVPEPHVRPVDDNGQAETVKQTKRAASEEDGQAGQKDSEAGQ